MFFKRSAEPDYAAELPPLDDALIRRRMQAVAAFKAVACATQLDILSVHFKEAMWNCEKQITIAVEQNKNEGLRKALAPHLRAQTPETVEGWKTRLTLEFEALKDYSTGCKIFNYCMTISEQYLKAQSAPSPEHS